MSNSPAPRRKATIESMDESAAVLDVDGAIVRVDSALLPAGSAEGSLLYLTIEAASAEEQEAAVAAIKAQIEALQKK